MKTPSDIFFTRVKQKLALQGSDEDAFLHHMLSIGSLRSLLLPLSSPVFVHRTQEMNRVKVRVYNAVGTRLLGPV